MPATFQPRSKNAKSMQLTHHHLSPNPTLLTPLPLPMLMIPNTQPPPRPRLTTPRILSQHNPLPSTLPHTPRAKSPLANRALLMTHPRLQHLPTPLASARAPITARPPSNEGMPRHPLWTRSFEFDDELAEEFRVPFVLVRFEQLVRFLVREEVED